MIAKDDLMYIGYIRRPHSYKGKVQITLDKQVVLYQGDFLFLNLDHQFIPFKVIEIGGKDKEPILCFEFVDDFDQAQKIAGSEIYVMGNETEEVEEEGIEGYLVIDAQLGKLSIIEEVREMPGQTMLMIKYNNQECLIPVVDDFITGIDHEKKELYVDLPEGLLEQ